MADIVKKHGISSELAQKMVDAAVAKARELGVSENVAILDDGGNLKAFSRMDGASMPTIEIAQKKAYTALFGVSTQDFFNFIQRDPSFLAGIPTPSRVAAWGGGFPNKVDGEIGGARFNASIRNVTSRALLQAFIPPSTVRFAPVMYEDSGPATNATIAAISSTRPQRSSAVTAFCGTAHSAAAGFI